jgi:hypothetical protein
MRYTGALLGGSWLTALTGNLDAGRARGDAVVGPRAARATPAPAPVRRSGPDPKDLP